MANLTDNTKRRILAAIAAGVQQHPDEWNRVSINIITDAVKNGKIIPNPEKLNIGTPIRPELGFEHYYVLEGHDRNIKLAVQILKKTAFKPSIGFAAFRISGKQVD